LNKTEEFDGAIDVAVGGVWRSGAFYQSSYRDLWGVGSPVVSFATSSSISSSQPL
jgi:hypothetical protein